MHEPFAEHTAVRIDFQTTARFLLAFISLLTSSIAQAHIEYPEGSLLTSDKQEFETGLKSLDLKIWKDTPIESDGRHHDVEEISLLSTWNTGGIHEWSSNIFENYKSGYRDTLQWQAIQLEYHMDSTKLESVRLLRAETSSFWDGGNTRNWMHRDVANAEIGKFAYNDDTVPDWDTHLPKWKGS